MDFFDYLLDAIGAEADFYAAGGDDDVFDEQLDDPLLLLGNQDIPDRVNGTQGFGDLVQFDGPDRGLLFQACDLGVQEPELVVETFEFVGQEVTVLVFRVQDGLNGVLGLFAVLAQFFQTGQRYGVWARLAGLANLVIGSSDHVGVA